MSSKQLDRKSLSGLKVKGLIINKIKNAPDPGTMHMSRSPGVPKQDYRQEHRPRSNPFPPGATSNLHPADYGSHELTIEVGTQIGGSDGRGIFEVNVVDSGNLPLASIPQLVIKVSSAHSQGDIRHEAHVYDDLKDIQGNAIPICYGHFTGLVEGTGFVSSWKRQEGGIPTESTGVSVILLEKLGKHISPPVQQVQRARIIAAYEEMIPFGISIHHSHVYIQHFLNALSGDDPNKIRIVDLVRTQKSNQRIHVLKEEYGRIVNRDMDAAEGKQPELPAEEERALWAVRDAWKGPPGPTS